MVQYALLPAYNYISMKEVHSHRMHSYRMEESYLIPFHPFEIGCTWI